MVCPGQQHDRDGVLATERVVRREMTGAGLIAALFGDEEVMTATPSPGRRRHARRPGRSALG
jgi:hypothetical protein